jgi:ATP-dependent DNA helicase RecQ
VFCTPERLATPEFQQLLQQAGVRLLVIDEAHCISQWGHDFRSAYLEIGAALAALGQPQLLALTATATDDVIADIRTQLARPAMRVVNTGVYRPNLQFRVRQVTNPQESWPPCWNWCRPRRVWASSTRRQSRRPKKHMTC